MEFPTKQYEIIYADPPWKYQDKALAGRRGACCKYPVQTTEWIASLPVSTIAADNASLFLWVTMPKLNECWEIITSWGFVFKTVAFTWVKRNKVADSWFWGMGRWTRSNAELCLLATKGKPKRISAGVHSIIDDRVMAHSVKPNTVRERIVQLMGRQPRIELFARERAEGWDAWGDDLNLK